jgi:uncharacterized membrane protein
MKLNISHSNFQERAWKRGCRTSIFLRRHLQRDWCIGGKIALFDWLKKKLFFIFCGRGGWELIWKKTNMADQNYCSPEILAEFLNNFEQNELDVCIM